MEYTVKGIRKDIMNMTQKELAEQLGLSRQYLSYVETGKRRGSRKFYKRLQKIANLTDADTWMLMKNK